MKSARPTVAELRDNQDFPVPDKFSFDRIEADLKDQ